MIIHTRRVKPDKLSHTAKRVIEDRDYFMQACQELQAEIRRLRCERDQARAEAEAYRADAWEAPDISVP